jgi:hypothetical protein
LSWGNSSQRINLNTSLESHDTNSRVLHFTRSPYIGASLFVLTMSSTPQSLEAADSKEMDATKQIEVAGELTWTPEEEAKLVRKIDLFLLPTIWLMYLLSYMDRTKYVDIVVSGLTIANMKKYR